MLSSLNSTHIDSKKYLSAAMSHYCAFALLIAAGAAKRTHIGYKCGDDEIDAVAERMRERARQYALRRKKLREGKLI